MRGKEGYCIMIRGSLFQEYTILNVYPPNNRISKHWKEKLIELQRETMNSLS